MSLNLNNITRPRTYRRNSFFDQQLPSSIADIRQTQSLFVTQGQPTSSITSSQILIPAEQLQQYLKNYEWRNQSQHSIVKCNWTGIYPAYQKQMIIQTRHKDYCFTLKNLNKVSLTQCIYILTSILPSFLELYMKFGSFNFSQQNIFFDQNLNCEVWINQNPSSNYCQTTQNSQKQIVLKIVKLLENHQLKSNIGKEFFGEIHQIQSNISILGLQAYLGGFIARKKLISKKNLIKQNFTHKKQNNVSSIDNIQIRNSTQNINTLQSQQILSFSQKKMQRKRTFKPLKQSHSTAICFRDQSEQSSSNGEIVIDKSNGFSPQKMIKSLFTQDNDKKINNKNYKSHMNQKQRNLIDKSHRFAQNVQEVHSQIHDSPNNHKKHLKLCPSTYELQIDPEQQKIDRVSKNQMNQIFKIFDDSQKQEGSNNYKVSISKAPSNNQKFQFSPYHNESNEDDFGQGLMRSTFSRIEQTNSRIQENQDQNLQSSQNPNQQHASDIQANILNQQDNQKIILPFMGNLANLQQMYNKRQMSNSITMPDYLGLCRKRSESPIKLQKLGKLKMQTAKSIIQQNGFSYYDD